MASTTTYVFSLMVQRTTRESGYSGGWGELKKEFETLHALIAWCDIYNTPPPAGSIEGWIPDEVNRWLDENDFPAIIGIGGYRCFEVVTTEIDMEKCNL